MILEVCYIKFNKEIHQKVYVKKDITFLELFKLLQGKQKAFLMDARDVYLAGTNERIFYKNNCFNNTLEG